MSKETMSGNFKTLIDDINYLLASWERGCHYEDYFLDVGHARTELSLFYANIKERENDSKQTS